MRYTFFEGGRYCVRLSVSSANWTGDWIGIWLGKERSFMIPLFLVWGPGRLMIMLGTLVFCAGSYEVCIEWKLKELLAVWKPFWELEPMMKVLLGLIILWGGWRFVWKECSWAENADRIFMWLLPLTGYYASNSFCSFSFIGDLNFNYGVIADYLFWMTLCRYELLANCIMVGLFSSLTSKQFKMSYLTSFGISLLSWPHWSCFITLICNSSSVWQALKGVFPWYSS